MGFEFLISFLKIFQKFAPSSIIFTGKNSEVYPEVKTQKILTGRRLLGQLKQRMKMRRMKKLLRSLNQLRFPYLKCLNVLANHI